MKRKSANKPLGLFLLICILVLASGGSVLADEIAPSDQPGLIVTEGSIEIRPEGSTYSADVADNEESFMPSESDPEIMVWAMLVDEDFDGTFPHSGVDLLNGNPGQDIFWGADKYRSFSPNKGVHPGGLGVDAYDPRSSYYLNDMYTWMVFGSFDLSTGVDARMEFELWMDTEPTNDQLSVCASLDYLSFYCRNYSGDSEGWSFETLNFYNWPILGDITGEPAVWIAFIFETNGSVTGPGVFIDDLVIRKTSSSLEPDMKLVGYYPERDLYNPGDIYSAGTVVANVGSNICTDYTIWHYLSSDTTITGTDYLAGFTTYTGATIYPGDYLSYVTGLTIPGAIPVGMYYLGAIIDCVGDTATSNNTYAYPNQIEVTAPGTGGILFQDNFELHDLTAWTRFNDGRTGLSACSRGAMNGEHGACFYRPAGNDKRRQLIDETPVMQDEFSVRFNIDVSALSMAEGERFRFMQVKMGAARPFFITMKYQGGQYLMQLNTLLDDLTKVKTAWFPLSEVPHTIEVDWMASSAPGANDGSIDFILDWALLQTLSNLDNDTIYVDTFKVGYTSRLEGKSISGTFYVDDVATSNGGYIGLP